MTKIFLPVLLFLSMITFSTAGEVRLFAAASLTDGLDAVGEVYRRDHPETDLVRNHAASGALARQIDLGAPADLFISANPKWMEFLKDKGRVDSEEIAVLTGNTLVFVGRPGLKINSLADLKGIGRIALGSPESVPAGQFAREALRQAGLFDRFLEEGKLVMAKDVRQAFIYAERGEVDGAFVYATDALLARRVVTLLTVPADLYTPVLYPMALTPSGRSNPDARAFFAFLQSPECRAILERYGFTTPRIIR